jgi:hypothetical protein
MFPKPTSVRTITLIALMAFFALNRSMQAAAGIDFQRDIRPILSDNCFACHGPDQDKRKAGLRLDTKPGAFAELESGGSAIIPGQPEKSRLLHVVTLPADDDDHMPPSKTGKRLTARQIDLLKRWINEGAQWKEHWAYMPPERPTPPLIKSRQGQVQNPIDAFVLTKLRAQRLEPNPQADRATLIRRASLDLTGLPPTVEEVDSFLADKNAQAYETVVDRLLASPHFGERMAQAWLDQARYADTAGYHFDGFRQMHLWRDWVIKAFNENKPFDQFTIEQIAGDLLPGATIEQKIATGFHRNVMTTDEGGVDPEEYLTKYQVDRVSTTAQVWLGTTMGCAECHDHKYDPITTRDFYRFYAFFNTIPEKGLDGTRVRNPGPILRVPSPEQGSQLLGYLDKIPAAEKVLTEREAELPKAQAKWEKEPGEAPPPTLAGLEAHFSFEAGTTHAPLPTNATPAGRLGQALVLRGRTNEAVSVGQVVQPDFTNAFSSSVWIKLHSPSGTVFSKMEPEPSYRGFDLLISNGKVEVHLIHEFPGNAIKVASKNALPSNVWTHLAMSYDGSKKAAGVTLFIDGRAAELDRPTDKLSASIRTDAPLLIGSRPKSLPFHGVIDELQFYQRRLSSNDVTALFARPHLLTAKTPDARRSPEERESLRRFFREHHAVEFQTARARVRQLEKEKKELLDQIPNTMVMEEAEKPRDTFILVRGNYQQKGARVTPGTPECWPPLPAGQPTNRLALARWLVATNNPLTARVTVNRLWAMFFGTGLVKTVNDFGSQGDQPSHPELLDWLACEFSAPPAPGPAWDMKRMVRLIVTSATYRQAATFSAVKLEKDPYNRLLARGPRIRLDAEFIRGLAARA